MIDPVEVERTYAVPPESVFDAWRDVAKLTRWWGCDTTQLWNVHEWEFEVGGAIRVSMDFDGTPYEVSGKFMAIEPNQLIRYSWEADQVITVSIEPAANGSKMTVSHAGLPSSEMGEIVTGGWSASVEQILPVLA